MSNNLIKKISRFFSETEKKAVREEKKIAEFIEYEESKLSKWGYTVLKKLFSPIVKWLWIDEVRGIENILHNGPVIVASNHESYFDFICFIAASPRKIHYLAAEKFFRSKFWYPLMKLTGQIRVDRKHPDKTKVFQQVFSALNQGRVIGIFPEGTRSSDGKLQKTFTGVAKIALQSKAPVIPVGVCGTYEIMSRHDKMPKLKKAKIVIGEPMHFEEFHNIEHTDKHFRFVTDKIMLKIAELTGKEYPHVEIINENELRVIKNKKK